MLYCELHFHYCRLFQWHYLSWVVITEYEDSDIGERE